MSTEAAAAVSTSTTPAAISGDPNAFTADEIAVMEGRGPASGASAGAPEARQSGMPAAENGAPAAAKADAADDSVEGEIEIGPDGAPRDLKTGRFVPRSQFLRAKEENKTLHERSNRLAEEVVRSRERLAIYAELSQPAEKKELAQQPAKVINPEEDIFGAFQQLMEENRAIREALNKTTQETQSQFATRELNEYVVADATKFAAQKPDFQKALQHALTVQDKIEARLGNTDPGERQNSVNDALRQIVSQSKKAGVSWAETVYNIALDYGYQPEAAAQQDVSAAARDGIDRINRGQAAAMSMRNAGSGGVPEQMTIVKLADMTEKEFLKVHMDYVSKNGVQAWNDFMAGKRGW